MGQNTTSPWPLFQRYMWCKLREILKRQHLFQGATLVLLGRLIFPWQLCMALPTFSVRDTVWKAYQNIEKAVSELKNLLVRFCWSLSIAASLVVAIVLTEKIFRDYQHHPFELRESTKVLLMKCNPDLITHFFQEHPVTNEPFPTIAICTNQFPDRWNLPRIVLNQLGDDLLSGYKETIDDFKVLLWLKKVKP